MIATPPPSGPRYPYAPGGLSYHRATPLVNSQIPQAMPLPVATPGQLVIPQPAESAYQTKVAATPAYQAQTLLQGGEQATDAYLAKNPQALTSLTQQLALGLEQLAGQQAQEQAKGGLLGGVWDGAKNSGLAASTEQPNWFDPRHWIGLQKEKGSAHVSQEVTKARQQVKILTELAQRAQQGDPDAGRIYRQQYEKLTGQPLVADQLAQATPTALLNHSNLAKGVQGYKDSQHQGQELIKDIGSGLIATGAVALAPVTGGASLAVAVGAGALSRTALAAGNELTATDGQFEVNWGAELGKGALAGGTAILGEGVANLAGRAVANKLSVKVAGEGLESGLANLSKEATGKAFGTTPWGKMGARFDGFGIAQPMTGWKGMAQATAIRGSAIVAGGALEGGTVGFGGSLIDGKSLGESVQAGVAGAAGGILFRGALDGVGRGINAMAGKGKVGHAPVADPSVPHNSADPAPAALPEARIQPEPEIKIQSDVEPTIQPEPEIKVQPDAEPTIQPEPEIKVQPEPEIKVQPEPEIKVQPEPEIKVQPEPEIKVQPEPEIKVQPDAEPTIQPEPEIKVQPDAEPTVQPNPEIKVQPDAEPTVQPEPTAPPSSEIVISNPTVAQKLVQTDRAVLPAVYTTEQLPTVIQHYLSNNYPNLSPDAIQHLTPYLLAQTQSGSALGGALLPAQPVQSTRTLVAQLNRILSRDVALADGGQLVGAVSTALPDHAPVEADLTRAIDLLPHLAPYRETLQALSQYRQLLMGSIKDQPAGQIDLAFNPVVLQQAHQLRLDQPEQFAHNLEALLQKELATIAQNPAQYAEALMGRNLGALSDGILKPGYALSEKFLPLVQRQVELFEARGLTLTQPQQALLANLYQNQLPQNILTARRAGLSGEQALRGGLSYTDRQLNEAMAQGLLPDLHQPALLRHSSQEVATYRTQRADALMDHYKTQVLQTLESARKAHPQLVLPEAYSAGKVAQVFDEQLAPLIQQHLAQGQSLENATVGAHQHLINYFNQHAPAQPLPAELATQLSVNPARQLASTMEKALITLDMTYADPGHFAARLSHNTPGETQQLVGQLQLAGLSLPEIRQIAQAGGLAIDRPIQTSLSPGQRFLSSGEDSSANALLTGNAATSMPALPATRQTELGVLPLPDAQGRYVTALKDGQAVPLAQFENPADQLQVLLADALHQGQTPKAETLQKALTAWLAIERGDAVAFAQQELKALPATNAKKSAMAPANDEAVSAYWSSFDEGLARLGVTEKARYQVASQLAEQSVRTPASIVTQHAPVALRMRETLQALPPDQLTHMTMNRFLSLLDEADPDRFALGKLAVNMKDFLVLKQTEQGLLFIPNRGSLSKWMDDPKVFTEFVEKLAPASTSTLTELGTADRIALNDWRALAAGQPETLPALAEMAPGAQSPSSPATQTAEPVASPEPSVPPASEPAAQVAQVELVEDPTLTLSQREQGNLSRPGHVDASQWEALKPLTLHGQRWADMSLPDKKASLASNIEERLRVVRQQFAKEHNAVASKAFRDMTYHYKDLKKLVSEIRSEKTTEARLEEILTSGELKGIYDKIMSDPRLKMFGAVKQGDPAKYAPYFELTMVTP